MNAPEGHRERLRTRFVKDPASLTEAEILELLLTYAIPRKDLSSLAQSLLNRFGSIPDVLSATSDDLFSVEGVGDAVVTFMRILGFVLQSQKDMADSSQLKLFNFNPTTEANETKSAPSQERSMRVFANDEIANTLDLLPKLPEFESLEAYKQYLNEKLPYNASETRVRRTNCILERFYPDGNMDIPLTFFIKRFSSQADFKPVIFYHLLKAEPIAAKVAEEFIWPALPLGRIERESMREFVLRYLPDAGASSQKNMLRALFYTYDLLGVGVANDTILRFQLHKGTLESFLYILTSEFPKPGIYAFEALYNGPLHRWMLWDREWIHKQLYNLQDFGILTKVSEIDTVRQFTMAAEQSMALRLFFEHPERNQKAIREQADNQGSGQEE